MAPADGRPDVVDCGGGYDIVYYYESERDLETFRRCEFLKPYYVP